MAFQWFAGLPDDPTIADECWVATICIDGTGEYPASETDGEIRFEFASSDSAS